MMKNNREDFKLIGHLQVVDEPLSSLYVDENGAYYIFVRTFENDENKTYVLSEVNLKAVLDYMEGIVGLKQMFNSTNVYSYTYENQNLNKDDFKQITTEKAFLLLEEDGLEDIFDENISYRSVMLKKHIKEIESRIYL